MKFIFEYKDDENIIKAVSSKYDQKSLDSFIKLTPSKNLKIELCNFSNGEVYRDNECSIYCYMVSNLDKEVIKPNKIFWVEAPNGNLTAQTAFGNVHISNDELKIYYPNSIIQGSKNKLKSVVNEMHEKLIKTIISHWI